MRVGELMTRAPASCAVDTPLREVAGMMVERDCGAIPVLGEDRRPIGVITDRDIVCRVVAEGGDARSLTAGDVMTHECVTVSVDTSAERCCEVLEENQIRRAIVVDEAGRCVGMIAVADLARRSEVLAGEVVAAVSRPSEHASDVH